MGRRLREVSEVEEKSDESEQDAPPTSSSPPAHKHRRRPSNRRKPNTGRFNPLYAGRAAESILSRMLASDMRPDAYSFASVLNAYQRIPNGRLDAALAADAVVRGVESLHLHGRIDDPPDVFHYTMVSFFLNLFVESLLLIGMDRCVWLLCLFIGLFYTSCFIIAWRVDDG